MYSFICVLWKEAAGLFVQFECKRCLPGLPINEAATKAGLGLIVNIYQERGISRRWKTRREISRHGCNEVPRERCNVPIAIAPRKFYVPCCHVRVAARHRHEFLSTPVHLHPLQIAVIYVKRIV